MVADAHGSKDGGPATQSAAEAARDFLKNEREFRLGELVTESFHPATVKLGETAQVDLSAVVPQAGRRRMHSAFFCSYGHALFARHSRTFENMEL